MTEQLPLFDLSGCPVANAIGHKPPTGRDLRDSGIKHAIEYAEEVYPSWQDQALSFLYSFAKFHDQFSGEQIREASIGRVPEPPSLRAWGGVVQKAARAGWIEKIGCVIVTNPDAHCCYASRWESRLFQGKK